MVSEILTLAKQENFRVNLIEAYDQPWKRQLEGTVGGYWGLLSRTGREPKFAWGDPVSDHPWWVWQLLRAFRRRSRSLPVRSHFRRRPRKSSVTRY